MKKIKIPEQSILLLTGVLDYEDDCITIQNLCEEIGYELSTKDCLNLWIMYSEAKYCEWVEVSLENVKRAINYVEAGTVWCQENL